MSGDGTRPGETDPAVRAVRMAGDYLTRVARWLSRRRAFGASLLDNPLLSRRLAAALVDLRAAQAVLATRPGADPAAEAERRAVAVHGAAACVERCAEVHAGAGVFDPAPDAVREIRYRLADRQPPNGPYERWPGPQPGSRAFSRTGCGQRSPAPRRARTTAGCADSSPASNGCHRSPPPPCGRR